MSAILASATAPYVCTAAGVLMPVKSISMQAFAQQALTVPGGRLANQSWAGGTETLVAVHCDGRISVNGKFVDDKTPLAEALLESVKWNCERLRQLSTSTKAPSPAQDKR